MRLAGDRTGDRCVRRLAYTALVGEPRGRRPGAAQRLGAAARAGHRGAGVRRRRCPTGCRPTRRRPRATSSRRATPRSSRCSWPSTSRTARTTGADRRPAAAGDLPGMPVVVADLHSALPAVLAGLRAERPEARVVYLMTDGGALPIAFSRTVAGLTRGRLAGRDGHRRPGLRRRPRGRHAALRPAGRPARRCGADVAVVTQGPGNVGTGTPWGYSGRRRRRGPQRRRHARRPGGRRAARLRGRPARAAPRHLPPQPHGIRAGVPGAADLPVPRHRPATSSATLVREQAHALVGRAPRPAAAARGRGRRPRRGAAQRARCGCRPWAAGWTRTTRPSCQRSSRAVCRPAAGRLPAGLAGRSARAVARSADVDEVDHEDQGLARLDRAAGATVAVGQVGGDGRACGGRRPSCRRCPGPSRG